MKYNVSAEYNEKTYNCSVNIRSDARMNKVFCKCMNAIAWELLTKKAVPILRRFNYDLPNIWRNGAVGAAWFEDPFINVTIQNERGCWLAM